MLVRLVELSIRGKKLVIVLLAVLLVGGFFAARELPIDAVPDVSTIQVSVLTDAPGLSPVEVERTVTFPVEMGLNGMPNLVELRSVSRSGLSAVTAIFKDGVDIWLARQMVLERVRSAEADLPVVAGKPQLSPVSGGLGEIYQFVVRSDSHSPTQLRTLLDWEIAPKLRQVPGIVEVNTMGGDLKEYQIVVDPARMHAQKMNLGLLTDALSHANVNVGGGYIERTGESLTLRGVGLLRNEEEIANVVLRTNDDGTAVLVKNIGFVRIGAAMRFGVITRDGESEAVTGITMMLIGANSRDVIHRVQKRVIEIQALLPPGVFIEPIYDRSSFLGRTLQTVMKNLVEGALVVTVVLALFLGSLRGALVVVLGIPASMAVALAGMHVFHITGDLMSLGAIDFGFLVDGPIVVLEAVIASLAGKKLVKGARDGAYGEVASAVVRPVAFSVAIIMLVYLPLLTLEGIEGKMFRPMAITMACALFGALLYSVVFFPALLVAFVPPASGHGPHWISALGRAYAKALPWAIRHRWPLFGAAATALAGSFVVIAEGGADFVPRIDEGDIVVTIRRAPSISLAEARDLDLAAERVLKRFPEVVTSLGMTGRAEVAIDPVGNDNTDLFVHLRPHKEWTSAHDLDSLSELVKNSIEREVPGTFVSVSQPIEDKTNELISGSRADVQIAIFGESLEQLKRLSEEVGRIVRTVPGSADVRVERLLGAPELTIRPDRQRLARYGIKAEDALEVVRAARIGIPVGYIYEGQRKFELRLVMPPGSPSPKALGELFVEASGTNVPLSEVANIEETEGPAQVRRENLTRTVRVEVNLRGRDLVSWVNEARQKVQDQVKLPASYEISWGGQFENFERAKKRLIFVVPMALVIIFGMLLWMFGDVRATLSVFAVVPFALVGGIMGLSLRGLAFSIPAAVGFIALAGVSVLNGVVLANEVKERIGGGWPLPEAVVEGATHTMRAVLTTGAVAAFGFLPMALATGAGAEVQRPLATVVISGIALSTLLTMFLLPGILQVLLRAPVRRAAYVAMEEAKQPA
ncbi:MAG TPA: CusA/CzcA family heavy metal efflux RND transporter [Polyangiaceae bacterium]|nr:CusA/CzcA family heavy metal efflux RND transporter [Polyangiaceae bacterium]